MFKDEYRKEMDQITPHASFLQELSEKMEQEGQAQKQGLSMGRGRYAAMWGGIVAAAALLCLGISIFRSGTYHTGEEDASLMTQNAGGIADREEGESIFDGSAWYGQETDPLKIYEIFVQKLKEDEDLMVSVSDTEIFGDEDYLSPVEAEKLVLFLTGGNYLGGIEEYESLLKGKPVYYLLECSDGTIIKCTVYEEQYLCCSDVNGVFELQSSLKGARE